MQLGLQGPPRPTHDRGIFLQDALSQAQKEAELYKRMYETERRKNFELRDRINAEVQQPHLSHGPRRTVRG